MRLIRADELEEKTGLSRTTIWRLEKAGEFPARRKLGRGAVAWLEDEVDEWIGSRTVTGPSTG